MKNKRWNPTDEELLDHIVYSGASQYEWYLTLETKGDNYISVEMEDEQGKRTGIKMFSSDVAKSIVNNITHEQLPGWKLIVRAVNEDDFDSVDADIVLQYCVFGQLVYG